MSDSFDPKAFLKQTSQFDPKAFLAQTAQHAPQSPQSDALAADLEDAGRGVIQGVTLGGADELYGAGAASIDKLKALITGEQTPDWVDLYRRYQQASEQNFKKSKERSPYLYGGGELAGALGTGIATAGLTPGLLAGAEGASVLGRVGMAAAEGAGMGAAGGALSSEGKLIGNASVDDKKKLVDDTIGGAETGAVLGGAIKGVTELAPTAYNSLKNALSPAIDKMDSELVIPSQMKTAFVKGTEGEGFMSQSSIDSNLKDTQDFVSNLKGKIEDTQKQLGQNMQNTLVAGDKRAIDALNDGQDVSGHVFNMQDDVKNASEGLKNLVDNQSTDLKPTQLKKLFKVMDDYNIKDLLPTDLYNFSKKIEAAASEIPDSDKETPKILGDLLNKIRGNLDQVDGFRDASDLYKKFGYATYDAVKNIGLPQEYIGKLLKNTANPEEDLYKGLHKIVTDARSTGTAGDASRTTLNGMISSLKNIEKENPGIFSQEENGVVSRSALAPEELGKNIRDQSDLVNVSAGIRRLDPHSGLPDSLLSMSTAKAASYGIANYTGQGVKAVSDLSKAVYNWPFEKVGQYGKVLQNNGPLKYLGDALVRAADNRDIAAKNAALFAILQNPNARMHLQETQQ